MEEQIYAMVELLAGSQADREDAVRALCRATEAALTARLRDGVEPEDCADSFVCAAAWMVWAALLDSESAGGAASFTAGEISVTRGDGQTVGRLREQAETLLAPYLRDGLSFLGVRG